MKERHDLTINDGSSDSLFLEVKMVNGKSVIIGVIYRPPDSDYKTFRDHFENILLHINQISKKCIIMGDFNINISKEDKNGTDFQNTLYSSSFSPTIDKCTRVTEKTKAIIDNIITNVQNTDYRTGVLYSDITDHYPILFFTNWTKNVPNPCIDRKVKVLNNKTLTSLIQHLQTKRWEVIYCTTDHNYAYNYLIDEITDSINKTIPEKTIKLNQTKILGSQKGS